jgi:hypothetical protein
MSVDLVNALAAVGTFLVIGATAIAAVVQLRHMRASNQLGALIALEEQFRSDHLQECFRFVQRELVFKMRDASYRAELERIGFIDSRVHLEVSVLNWFNQLGALLKNNLVDETAFMDLFSRLAVQYWEMLAPAIAVMRRRRGSGHYHSFEYLAIRARKWISDHPQGSFPKGTARIPLVDEWLDEDQTPAH